MLSARPLPVLLMAVLAAGSAGCGLTSDQRAAVDRFGRATIDLADLATETLIRAREDVVALRTGMLELGAPSVDLADGASDLDSSLDLVDLEARLRIASKVKEYASLLQSLVNDDSGARIKATTDSFLDSLEKFKGIGLDGERKQAIASILSDITGLWIDCQKKKALKEVVPWSRPHVDTLIGLWQEDFDPEKAGWVRALASTEKEIQGSLKNALWNLKPGDPVPKREKPRTQEEITGLQARYDEIRADAARRRQGMDVLCGRIQASLRELLEASKELEDKIRYEDYSVERIGAFVAKAEECRRLFRALRENKAP